jgi:hypothetical protein
MTEEQKEMPDIQKREIVALFIMLLFFALFRINFVSTPLDGTEGSIALCAKWDGHGLKPYRDMAEVRMPMNIYLYKTAFIFDGVNAEAPRKLAVVYFIICAALLYSILRLFMTALPAFLALGVYCLYQNTGAGGGLGAYPGFFAQLPLMAAFMFMYDVEEGYEGTGFAVAGFFCGVSFMTDIFTIIFGIFAPVFFAVISVKKPRMILWYAAGFGSVAIAAVLWAAVSGSLPQFLDSAVIYRLRMVVNGAESNIIDARNLMTSTYLLACLAAAWCGLKFLKNSFSDGGAAPLAASGFLIAGALLNAKSGEPGYAAVFIPFLCILAGLAAVDVIRLMDRLLKNKAAAGFITVIIFGLYAGYHVRETGMSNFAGAAEHTDISHYEAAAATGNAGGRVFVWPDNSEAYFYNGGKPASRFINEEQVASEPERRKEQFREVTRELPDEIIAAENARGQFAELIKNNYVKTAGGRVLGIYARKLEAENGKNK